MALALAGCSTSASANEAPVAVLNVDKPTNWSGEVVTFDARESRDPDGGISTIHFDFGDQMTADSNSNATARQTHSYVHGGIYMATVTVTDNGTKDAAPKTDQDVERMVVNQRATVSAPALTSSPANLTATASMDQDFEVYEHADHVEAMLNVTSLTAVGNSQVVVKITSPDNLVIAEKTVDVPAGQTVKVELEGDLSAMGTHTLELDAEAGAVAVTGTLSTYYA